MEKAVYTINKASTIIEVGGQVAIAMQEFSENLDLLRKAEEVLNSVEKIQNAEVGLTSQLKTALQAVFLVDEKAFVFLDKVNDVIYYCRGEAMANAREALCSTVSLQQARGLW